MFIYGQAFMRAFYSTLHIIKTSITLNMIQKIRMSLNTV